MLKEALADPKCALIECTTPMEDNCSPITLAGANNDDLLECKEIQTAAYDMLLIFCLNGILQIIENNRNRKYEK